MRVAAARGTAFRCYARVDVAFAGGLVGVVGPNGAGKTSLIEMIHFGCAGYSPRTTTESQVIRFGSDVTRVEVDVALRSGPVTSEVGFRPGEPKRVTVAGAPERSVAGLLARFPVLVFTPDRLREISGGAPVTDDELDDPTACASCREHRRCGVRGWTERSSGSGRRSATCRPRTLAHSCSEIISCGG